MRFIEIISHKKYTLINMFLFLFFLLNLLDGERGLISYIEKQKIKDQLTQVKMNLTNQLILIEKKNNLLTNNIDLDYLETIYRKKFMVGKPDEKVYIVD
jgi:cell division protein DivIC